jgi:SAM-dependent methyltransferase
MCSLFVRADVLRAVGGAEEHFPGLFEDQALLAKLHLRFSTVIDGGFTARYRRHPWSSTAMAEQGGSYHPYAANPAYETLLRWLRRRPELAGPGADPDLLQALTTALAPYDQPPNKPAQVRQRASIAARKTIPAGARRLVRRAASPARPALTGLRLLRPVEPLSRHFGYERGQPVDRWYIEQFLAENAENISGAVLEVGSATYTRYFGGRRVQRSDVLNVRPGDPETTFVADLADAPTLPSGAFDCIILTQTLHLIFDLCAAVRTVHRVLRPGGVALVTVPGISPVSLDQWSETWFWSLTPLAAERLFGDVFGPPNVEVAAKGNVASAVAFLQGRSAGELHAHELDVVDPQYPMLVTVRAFRMEPESAVQ